MTGRLCEESVEAQGLRCPRQFLKPPSPLSLPNYSFLLHPFSQLGPAPPPPLGLQADVEAPAALTTACLPGFHVSLKAGMKLLQEPSSSSAVFQLH